MISEELMLIESLLASPILYGEIIKLIKSEGEYFQIERSRLSARFRMLF
jgi:hypothetical protein